MKNILKNNGYYNTKYNLKISFFIIIFFYKKKLWKNAIT
jgi:hypothetical protein